MLVIRMQRTGRKGHAQFRVVVQDSRRTPTSGRVVASLGNYNPHAKQANLNKEKAAFYLEHGAQPSDRVARLLKAEGVKLPGWVKLEATKKRDIRNVEKLRKNRPSSAEATEDKPSEAAEDKPAEPEAPADEVAPEEPTVEVAEAAADEKPAEDAKAEEAVAEEPAKNPDTDKKDA
jgi:small subunit ribosomal protein S16